MSKSESEAVTVSDEGGSAALSPDRGVSSTSLDVASEPPVIVIKVPTDVPSSEAEVTSTSSGTCTSWNLSTLDAALEEKDPFLGMSEEDMNRLDSVLFSEEGQKVLETSVPAVTAAGASKGHVTVTPTGAIGHLTSELPELNTIGHSDFVIDDVIIQEGLKEDLSAFADSFGDHGYCANPEQVSITLSSTSIPKEEEEKETEDFREEKEESTDEKSRDESSTNLPIRRSTRIHEHKQHQEAEQIMQENMEKEKKARKSLLGDDSPAESTKKSPAVKHYNMRTKRPPRDYPDFVTPKQQRISRGKTLDGRGDGIEETKAEKGNNTQSDLGSSDSDNGGNTTGSTKGQRPVRGKRMRTRSGRACKKEAEVSTNEGDSTEGTSQQKPARQKAAKSKSNEKMKSLSSSDDSENETLGEIRNRTKRVRRSKGKRSSESSDAPLSVIKSKQKEHGKIEGLKEEDGDKLSMQVVLNKVKSKIHAEKGTGDNGKVGKTKKEGKLKSEDESKNKAADSEHIVVKSKKRIRKGRKKQKGVEEEKEGESGTKEKATTLGREGESDSSPAVEEDSDSDWGSEDDPDRLWCICKKPYANRFMICCDDCKDWFHGSCMGLTRRQGTDIVRKNHTWLCPKCTGKGGTRQIREQSLDSSGESTGVKPVIVALTRLSDDGVKPCESTSTITISSVGTDGPVKSDIKTEEALTDDKEEDSVKKEVGTDVKTEKLPRPPPKHEMEALQAQLQELKRKRQHRVAGPNDAAKTNEEMKTKTKSTPGSSLEDKRGSAEDRRGSAEDRRGSAEDRRGSAEDRTGGRSKTKPKVSCKDRCISTDCTNRARPGSVYCSDSCIAKHAQESLELIGTERKKTYGNRSQPGTDAGSGLAASERIVVFDRKTGKIVTGPVAPTPSTLESWLARHNSFEVLRPGSQVTQSTKSFYSTAGDKKEKPQPKRPDQNKIKQAIQGMTVKPPVKDVNNSTSVNRHHSVSTAHRRASASSNPSRDHKHAGTKTHESRPHTSVPVPTREPVKSRPRISSGEHTRKPHEVKVRRDSHSTKKTKHPEQEKVAPPPEQNFGPDPVRISIRKMLRDLLNKRANDADDIMLSGAEIKQLALDIEEELFKYYGGVTSKYKNKYRSLVFNVKDPKNKGLFRKVMNAEIKPHDLVRLSSEQLASKELAMWREQETKHSLEMIEKSEKEVQNTQVIKKTHKGEVPVDDEDLSILENKAETTSDVVGNVLMDDTTKQHKNHLFDLNCKICTGKMAPPADDEAPPQKRVRIGKTIVCGENKLSRLEEITIGEIRQRNRDDEMSKDILYHDDDDEYVATSSDIVVVTAKVNKEDVTSDDKTQSAAVLQDQRAQLSETGGQPESKSGLKSCLKGKPAGGMSKSSLSESSAVAVSTTTVSSPDSVPSSSVEPLSSQLQEPYVWKGFILIQDMLKFVTVAYHVSGPTDHLREELPVTIDVRGRISPEQVWDYLSRLRHMIGTMRELTVIRFKYATAEEKSSYMQLYSYLSSRNRCGVIGCVGRVIKDMYLVPLASHDRIPSVLLPFDGPGLEVNRPHILLGILIKQKTKRPHQAGPRNIYTVRPEFREKGGSVSTEAELPAKRVCVTDNDSSVGPPVATKPHAKPTKPHQPSSGKEGSPDSVIMEISEKQRNDPIVKEYALADPRIYANEPAPGSSPYSPPEDEGDEDEPYDPEYGLDSPVAMATTGKTDVKATKMTAATSAIPPGGSTTVGDGSVVGQLVGSATTTTEITAAMLATLAGSSGLSEQRKVLIQLTEKVEEQKRAIQQQMELTQRTKAPKAGHSTVTPSTEPKVAPTTQVEPAAAATAAPVVSVMKPVPSIPLPLVTSDLYTPKSGPNLSTATKAHVTTVDLATDNKLQPVASKASAPSTQPPELLLPLEAKKVPNVIPNVARKRLAEKTGVTPPTTSVVTPFSGNLSLLPPSVQMLLTGGAVQTPETVADKTQESQPAPDEGNSNATEVKLPVDVIAGGDEARTVEDVEKREQDNPIDKGKITPTAVEEIAETTASAVTSCVNATSAHNAGMVPESQMTSRPPEPAVLNPHGDVDYRIPPTGRFPAPPQGPPTTGPRSSWQPAFQTKPQEASSSSAGPKPEWAPAFPAAVTQKQPDWTPAVPTAKTSWELTLPTETSRPADPRQRAAEERMRNAAFPPNAVRMKQSEGGVRPLMWNVRPPVQGPPGLRFGTLPRPTRAPMRMPLPPPPPCIPNAAAMPSGDIDERIRPPWPPGGVARPWPPSEVRSPRLPPPDNTERKPAAVPSLDLSALGKFAVEFLKEQQQKGQGVVPPITSSSSNTVPPLANALGIPLPANVIGKPPSAGAPVVTPSANAHSMPPSVSPHGMTSSASPRRMPPSSNPHGMTPSGNVPSIAPPTVGRQTATQLGTASAKSSDTDERHRNVDGQLGHQVACSTAKFQGVSSAPQVTSWEQKRSVRDGVTSLSQQPGSTKQGISTVAEKANQKDALAKGASKNEERATQDKLKTTASCEKAKVASEKKEGSKSDSDPCQIAKNDRESETTGKTKSKWVPLGASVSKQSQNCAATAPHDGMIVQHTTEEVSTPSPNKNGAKSTKVTPVQIKQLGKSLVETKTPQLLDPVEAKPLLKSLAEIKLAQASVSDVPMPIPGVRTRKESSQSSAGESLHKSQQRGRGQAKAKETVLVKQHTDSRSSGEAALVSEHGSTKSAKDERTEERTRNSRTSSTKSSDSGHRTRSRSRERQRKERRRSHSRDRQSGSRRNRRRSRSKSRGRATKHRSRSRSRDRDAKRRGRSRERGPNRRSRSRSRDRGVKRRSRSRDRDVKRDRDARRRSRSGSRLREHHSLFRTDRGRHEREMEREARRSPPANRHAPHERVSREDRISNDEVCSNSQDVDQRTAGHGDRDERYMTSIPTLGEPVGHTDTATSKPPGKPPLEGSQDTDERVEAGRLALASPFVRNAAELWSEPPPPGDSRVGDARASGDKDDREQWRRHGGQELGRVEPSGVDPRMQPLGDPHMPTVPFARPLGDRPFMLPPPGEPMMTPRPPPAWMPPMMAPRPPLMRPGGPPEQPPFPPRYPNRGWPRGPPGGRPGPW